MTRKKKSLFYMIIVNWDTRKFSVRGPMTDDTAWTNIVREAQKSGVHCNCHVHHNPTQDIIQSYARQQKIQYVENDVI